MSEQTYCIYKHTSPSGKSYIGQTNNYKRRCSAHNGPVNGCRIFFNAIKKYGWGNFTHEILEDGLTLEDANIRESYYISEYNTLSPDGYNLKDGGNVSTFSQETKELMSKKATGRKLTGDTKLKIAAQKIGIARNESTRKKISESSIGRKSSDDVKIAQSIRMKEKWESNSELRIELSERNKATKRTDETRLLMSKSAKANITPELRDIASERMKLRYQNPINKVKTALASATSHAKRANRPFSYLPQYS